MRTPSPSWCGLDRTHLWPTGSSLGDPIDYGPELLLMPFGFHLAMDTLPSGDRKWWLQVRLGCIRLSSSCPFRRLHTFHFSGQRGFQPRFWIQCSSSEHRRDFNPPDQRAAQRTPWQIMPEDGKPSSPERLKLLADATVWRRNSLLSSTWLK